MRHELSLPNRRTTRHPTKGALPARYRDFSTGDEEARTRERRHPTKDRPIASPPERAAIRALKTFERRCTIINITDSVLTRAGRPFPVEPIRTLDAIHLATVELLGEAPQLVTIVTRDICVRENAQALGYVVA